MNLSFELIKQVERNSRLCHFDGQIYLWYHIIVDYRVSPFKVCRSAKYICRIDKFFRSAMKSGYMSKFTPFAETTRCRDINLWEKISANKSIA